MAISQITWFAGGDDFTSPVIAAERDNDMEYARWRVPLLARSPGSPEATILLVLVAGTIVEATYFYGRAVARTYTSKIAWTAEGSDKSV